MPTEEEIKQWCLDKLKEEFSSETTMSSIGRCGLLAELANFLHISAEKIAEIQSFYTPDE